MKRMKVLVTGACGYQGSLVVPKLLQIGYKVLAVDTQWFGNSLKKHKNLKILKKNTINIKKEELRNIDIVLHLASIANDPMGDLHQHLTWEYSCISTMRLLEFAIQNNVKKFIYASSGSVYGLKNEKNVTEELSLEPLSTYNKAKMVAERLLLSYKDKINISIIRPATVCGLSKRMRFDLSVNMLTYQAMKNKKITIFGGDQIRPNIHIDDLLEIYVLFFSNNKKFNGIFNAGFENLSIMQIAKKVQSKIPCEIIKIKNTNDPRSYRVNSDKLLRLGYKPKKNVSCAIEEIMNFYSGKINKVPKNSFSIDWLKKKSIT
jgi:nucleoside-diphosphate-sugar epimerase